MKNKKRKIVLLLLVGMFAACQGPAKKEEQARGEFEDTTNIQETDSSSTEELIEALQGVGKQ